MDTVIASVSIDNNTSRHAATFLMLMHSVNDVPNPRVIPFPRDCYHNSAKRTTYNMKVVTSQHISLAVLAIITKYVAAGDHRGNHVVPYKIVPSLSQRPIPRKAQIWSYGQTISKLPNEWMLRALSDSIQELTQIGCRSFANCRNLGLPQPVIWNCQPQQTNHAT